MKAYTEEALVALNTKELKQIARGLKVKGYGRLRKGTLVSSILELAGEVEAAPVEPAVAAKASPDAAATPSAAPAAEAPTAPTTDVQGPTDDVAPEDEVREARQAYQRKLMEARQAVTRDAHELREDDEGELPDSYGMNLLTLLPVSPAKSYVYWDLSASTLGEISAAGRVVLRLFESARKGADFTLAHEVEVDLGARNYYFATAPGRFYRVELGVASVMDCRVVVSSNIISTPSDSVSEDANASYTSVPLEQPLPERAEAGSAGAGRVLSREEYRAIYTDRAGDFVYTRDSRK